MIFPKKKKKVEKKEETTSNVVLGSLYDMNKGLVEKSVPDLTAEELESKKTLVADFLKDTNNKYYMLLCNDRKDYTIFRRASTNNVGTELINILIDECLKNRGKTKSIELTEAKDAIEIWLSIDEESYCYYFFPYDTAVIQC